MNRPLTVGEMSFATLFFAVWMAGIVLAKGFWSTLLALFPLPWGWYLVVEKIMIANGWA